MDTNKARGLLEVIDIARKYSLFEVEKEAIKDLNTMTAELLGGQLEITMNDNQPRRVPNLDENEIAWLNMGNRKLDAVKAYKVRTNLSLMESKRAVEKYMEIHGIR